MHRFAVLTSVCTFLLIVAGGLVTSTQSGLSVPDWPNTYGHFMFLFPLDQMVGGIFYEHSHRMIASVVGFLTVILTVWILMREKRKFVRRLSLVALAAVIIQGVLGGITVLYLLPTAVSVSHATLAQTFFAMTAALALFTSTWWHESETLPPASGGGSSLTVLAGVTAAAVWIQLILGGVLRHTGSGLAVPDFPLAYGSIFPSLSPDALQGYNDMLIRNDIRIAADDPVTAGQITLHLLHRYWGMFSGVLLLLTSVRFLRNAASPRFRTLGWVMALLTVLQITLGACTVLTLKAVEITTAHVATGALLLVVSVLMMLHAYRVHGLKSTPARPGLKGAAA